MSPARTHGDAYVPTPITEDGSPASLTDDARGNLTADTPSPGLNIGRSYALDADGMLAGVPVPTSAAAAGHGVGGTHTYEYDVPGRRVKRTVSDAANSTTTQTLSIQRLVSLPPLGTPGGQVV